MFFGIFLMYHCCVDVILEPFSRSKVGLPMMKMSDLVSSDLKVVWLSKEGEMSKITDRSCAKGVRGVR